ncbi:MAG: homocysteine S-methyltransferase family protein [Pelolinea sp.]|nr:homocysteine S-methyltransferase family protein [Pelolinea sp.]
MGDKDFSSQLEQKKLLVSDGATGTNLIQRGLPSGKTSEEWVLENPDKILQLHSDFINAGSDIILTSTFGGSKVRLEQSGLADRFYEVNSRAVAIAKEAVKNTNIMIAGSMGPLGHMLKPMGLLDEKDAEKYYRDQAKVLSDSGVDILLVETQFDLTEASIGVNAAISISNLPVICSLSFDRGTKTMMGVSPTKFAQTIGKLGVTALGINCGKSLDDNLNALKELADATDLPIWFKPNAGLPKLTGTGQPVYDVTPEIMASHVESWIASGAKIIGGCCGTSPEHLRSIADVVHKIVM